MKYGLIKLIVYRIFLGSIDCVYNKYVLLEKLQKDKSKGEIVCFNFCVFFVFSI